MYYARAYQGLLSEEAMFKQVFTLDICNCGWDYLAKGQAGLIIDTLSFESVF